MELRPSKVVVEKVRCGYCHSDDGKLVACTGCGTQLHAECKKELGHCPTIGCDRRRERENTYEYRPPRREGVFDAEPFVAVASTASGLAVFRNFQAFTSVGSATPFPVPMVSSAQAPPQVRLDTNLTGAGGLPNARNQDWWGWRGGRAGANQNVRRRVAEGPGEAEPAEPLNDFAQRPDPGHMDEHDEQF